MRSFKKKLLMAGLTILLCVPLYMLFYIMEIPDYAAYTKLMLDEMYHGEDKDIIFLGSSKTYSTICPETVQENLGMSAFDLASSGQGMMGGYYLLEEYFKYHSANYVVLEMQENKLLGFGLDEKGIHAANYQITDSLKKDNRTFWKYFKEAYSFDNYFSAFFPVSHYRSNFTFTFAKNRLLSGEFLQILKTQPYGEYRGDGYLNGYTYNGEEVDKSIVLEGESVLTSDTELCEKSVEYFEKTLELCNKNKCRLILVTYPVIDSAGSLNRIQECRDFYVEFASRYDLDYLNMMLCKEYAKVKDDAYDFEDKGHMNDSGARKHTYYLCKELEHVFHGDDYSQNFYSNAYDWKETREALRE